MPNITARKKRQLLPREKGAGERANKRQLILKSNNHQIVKTLTVREISRSQLAARCFVSWMRVLSRHKKGSTEAVPRSSTSAFGRRAVVTPVAEFLVACLWVWFRLDESTARVRHIGGVADPAASQSACALRPAEVRGPTLQSPVGTKHPSARPI